MQLTANDLYCLKRNKMKKKTLSTRNQLERLITLHELLSTGFHYSLDDFARACEKRLGDENKPSVRTLFNDLERLREEYKAPLAPKNRQVKPYWYTRTDFSLYGVFNKEDAALANEATALLKQVSYLPQFAGLEDVFLKFKQRAGVVGKAETSVVQYEQNLKYKGLKWLNPLYDAIRADHMVLLDYTDFKGESFRFQVSPYLLKEYNNRWFIFGWVAEQATIYNLALDRIQSITSLPNLHRRPDDRDWDLEFAEVIGATRSREPVETLVLRVSHTRAPYIETKPLHHSQDPISQTDQHIDFQYQLRWNNELMARILELGPDAELLSPPHRRTEIAEKVQGMSARYIQ